jgi:hypothetical protein
VPFGWFGRRWHTLRSVRFSHTRRQPSSRRRVSTVRAAAAHRVASTILDARNNHDELTQEDSGQEGVDEEGRSVELAHTQRSRSRDLRASDAKISANVRRVVRSMQVGKRTAPQVHIAAFVYSCSVVLVTCVFVCRPPPPFTVASPRGRSSKRGRSPAASASSPARTPRKSSSQPKRSHASPASSRSGRRQAGSRGGGGGSNIGTVFEVEAIVDKTVTKGATFYKLRWKGQ